jgi:hypothetical protein
MEVVESLAAHAKAGGALDLRAGRLIAWFKREDLRSLGYASYRVFAAEHVDWHDSWMRAIVRLVESPLELVKGAVCAGRLSMRRAVEAPAETTVEDEARWLAEAIGTRAKPRRRQAPAPEVDLSGEDMATVHAARELARIHLGYQADDASADRHILAAWRRHDPEATRREALTPGPAPEPLPPWCEADDPATALLGPWVEPTSLEEGLSELRRVNAHRRERVLEMGALYRRVVDERLWREGWTSLGEMLRCLDLDQRTLQRAARLTQALDDLPDTAEAVATGQISLDHARKIASIACEEDEADWLQLDLWYTRPDFARLVELASRGVPIVATATRVIDALIDELGVHDRVTFSSIERPLPAPRNGTVHAELLEAARWYLANLALPRQYGAGKAKEKDRFRCRNPEDRRPTLRAHTHHTTPRSKGGTDDPDKLVTGCPSCHLRGVHGGAFTIEVRPDRIVWTYPGRRIIELRA